MVIEIKIKKTTLIGILGVMIIAGIVISYSLFFGLKDNTKESEKIGIAVGNYAPPLTFETVEGQKLALSDFKGKPLILQGFASWCPSCKFQAQEIDKALETLGDDVQVVSLDIWEGETADDVKSGVLINDVFGSYDKVPENWQFTAYEPDFVTTYQVYGMDQTYILDENGKIMYRDAGITPAETFLLFLGGR